MDEAQRLKPSTLRALLTLRHPVFRRPLGRLSSAAVSVAQAAQGQSGKQANVKSTEMTESVARESLGMLVARGAHLMFVFTGGVNHVYNYHGQLFDLLPGFDFRSQLALHYMPETDHTVADRFGRARLLREVGDWLERSFPLRVPAPPRDRVPEVVGTAPPQRGESA